LFIPARAVNDFVAVPELQLAKSLVGRALLSHKFCGLWYTIPQMTVVALAESLHYPLRLMILYTAVGPEIPICAIRLTKKVSSSQFVIKLP
jgi:hypothetical protein